MVWVLEILLKTGEITSLDGSFFCENVSFLDSFAEFSILIWSQIFRFFCFLMAYDSKHTLLLDSKEGYNLTETEYKKYWPHLNSFYSLDFNRFVPRERKGYRVLDLGAWDGRMYEQLMKISPDEYVACDCAEKLLAKHPSKGVKVICDLQQDWTMFEDESFDLLCAFFLLEHIEDLEHFFAEAYRVLKPNGQILIGHFLQRRLFLWNINAKRFKIVQYPHTIEEIEKEAKEIWFFTGIMPLRDVCDSKVVTGHFLVAEKR